MLQSGANTNSVPDLATLRFDRRLVPSESLEVARAQIQGVLDDVCKEFPEVVYKVKETYHTEPIWVDENLEVCKIWTGAVQTALGVKAGIVCSPGSDDQRCGTLLVVFASAGLTSFAGSLCAVGSRRRLCMARVISRMVSLPTSLASARTNVSE